MGYADKVLNKEVSFKDFILRRLKRLYPLFIVSTVLVLIFELLYCHRVGETFIYLNCDIYHIILNLLVLHYGILGTEYSLNGPAWVIPIFLLCYCMMYYVIRTAKTRKHILYKFCFIMVVGSSIVASELNYPLINYQIGRGVTCYSVGAIIYYIYDNKGRFNSYRLGCCSLTILLMVYLLLRFDGTDYLGNPMLAMDLGIGPMIIVSVLFIPWQNAVFRNPVFIYLGKISWDVFMLHFPVQCLIRVLDVYMDLRLDYSSGVVWIAYVLTTLLIAILYHFLLSSRIEFFILNFFKYNDSSIKCNSN